MVSKLLPPTTPTTTTLTVLGPDGFAAGKKDLTCQLPFPYSLPIRHPAAPVLPGRLSQVKTNIYIYKRGLSVCLFVCSDFEPKPLDGSQPNLAWTFLWSLKVTSKYFFWVDPPPRGV